MIRLTMKKLLIIIIISLSVSIFGKGSDETKKDTKGNTVGFISVGQSFGLQIYNFNDFSASEEVKYIVMEINGVYYNQSHNKLHNQIFFSDLLSDIVTTNSKIVEYDDKEFTLEDGQIIIDESELLAASIIKEEGSCIKIKSSIEPIDIKAWTITETGNLTKISATLTPNFFDGEKDFFNKLFEDSPHLSYEEKIIFFLSTFFTEEIKDNDGNVTSIKADDNWTYFVGNSCSIFSNINSTDIPKISDQITTLNFNDIYPELIKYQKIFKASFASHFLLKKEDTKNKNKDQYIGREAKLPYIDIKAESFDSIYGNKNPYISIYLNYLFLEDELKSKKSKPVLSYLIDKKINENSNEEIKYNYTQYRQVTKAEGESIAKSALRYITWGLEYAPGTTSELENNNSDKQVYGTNPEGINNWVKYTKEDNTNRIYNYFSGTITPLTKPLLTSSTSPVGILYNKGMFTSPYSSIGNPIAYSAMGIDTPKTFNYKMVRQTEARDWMLINRSDNFYYKWNFPELYSKYTGIHLNVRFQRGYLNEITLYAEDGITLSPSADKYKIELPALSTGLSTVEPFLPGIRSKDSKQYVESTNSMYHPNKIAGVDSLGLLMGTLTMADINGDFLNVFNTKVDEKLDKYNRSLPKFHVTDNNNILKKPYRFTRTDIEKSTVLIPDLSLARAGDILVKFSKKEPVIGVIASTGFSSLTDDSTVEDYMKNITVVSINSGFRMANIGVWLGDNNIYGGFSKLGDEKSYYLRRLLVKPTGLSEISYEKDNFELFDSELLGLDIDLVHEVENEPWIPNTGELYKFKKIIIKGLYSGEPSTLYDDDKSVEILPPLDMYRNDYVNDESNDIEVGSNIYQNKGKGLKFYALDGKNAILLATFTLKTAIKLSALSNGDSPYNVLYNDEIFKTVDGKVTSIPKDNFDLLVANNKLTFKLKNGKALYRFGVRPFKDNIRPGDDFLLRFGKRQSPDVQGVAKSKDFIAVYDKKMLWRANLYIDENDDWNDRNSWNAPPTTPSGLNMGIAEETGYYSEFGFINVNGSSNSNEKMWYGLNEWNRVYDGKARLSTTKNEPTETEYLNNLTVLGDGKQVVKFNDFTYNPKIDNTLEENTVAYAYGCSDSPFEFNDELRQQQIILSDYYNIKGIKFKESRSKWPHTNISDFTLEEYNTNITDYPIFSNPDKALNNIYPKKVISLDGWQKTSTPSDMWYYNSNGILNEGAYIYPSDIWSNVSDTTNYETNNQNSMPVNTAMTSRLNFPYLPGWALWYYFANENSVPPDWVNVISAGVDCNGFVSRSASYSGNKYGIYKNRNQDVTKRTDWFTNPQYPYWKDVLKSGGGTYPIISDKISEMEIGEDPMDLDKIKPGDIMYLQFANGKGWHITMVLDVDKTDGNITIGDVKLIESTWDGDKTWAKVHNEYTLKTYENNNWVVVRSKNY